MADKTNTPAEETKTEMVKVQGTIPKDVWETTFGDEAWELRMTKGQYMEHVLTERAAQWASARGK